MLPACVCLPDAGDAYCCDAYQAWQDADYARAEEATRRILEDDPKDATAWLLLGFALQRTKKPLEAMAIFETLADHAEVGSVARSILRMNRNRRNRNDVHLSVGYQAGIGNGAVGMLDIPMFKGLGVRIDVGYVLPNYWLDAASTFGWKGGLFATAGHNLGVWQFQLVGGFETYRLRAPSRLLAAPVGAVRADVRVHSLLGFGMELGATGADGQFWGHYRTFLTVFPGGASKDRQR